MNFLRNLFGGASSFKVEAFILMVIVSVFLSWHFISLNKAVERTRYETTTKIETIYKERIRVLKVDSDKTEKELRDTIASQQKEKDEERKLADTKYRALLASVRNRPERPSSGSSLPSDSGNQKSTGFMAADRLYRDDAEVAIWFASRTEGLKIELQGCYKQYDAVKSKLDKFKQEHTLRTN
jgi:hypothetical protein